VRKCLELLCRLVPNLYPDSLRCVVAVTVATAVEVVLLDREAE
jgi:hypothetical protein